MRDHQHVAAARGKRLLSRFAEEAFQARLHLVEAFRATGVVLVGQHLGHLRQTPVQLVEGQILAEPAGERRVQLGPRPRFQVAVAPFAKARVGNVDERQLCLRVLLGPGGKHRIERLHGAAGVAAVGLRERDLGQTPAQQASHADALVGELRVAPALHAACDVVDRLPVPRDVERHRVVSQSRRLDPPKRRGNGLLIPNARRARLGARSGCLHPASASWRE